MSQDGPGKGERGRIIAVKCRSWLPAASERSIDLHKRLQLTQLGLGHTELRREHPRVAVQHFQIARCAAPVADVGQPPRVRSRAVQQDLLLSKLAALAIA